MIRPKIITGGQTGVDQGALDFAIDYQFESGGFCPKGRICEAGVIPFKYHLVETDSDEYLERTRKNVLEADGVLIIHDSVELMEGAQNTIKFANQFSKPLLMINTDDLINYTQFVNWLVQNEIGVLNIAGNRASQNPGIKAKTYLTLIKLFNLE